MGIFPSVFNPSGRACLLNDLRTVTAGAVVGAAAPIGHYSRGRLMTRKALLRRERSREAKGLEYSNMRDASSSSTVEKIVSCDRTIRKFRKFGFG